MGSLNLWIWKVFWRKMTPKFIHNLSGEELGKECIRFGLSGRFSTKEALVELTTSLVRNNLDPKTHQYFPSQPLQGYFPYQVVILTDIVETMKVFPTSLSSCSVPSTSTTSSSMASPSAFTGVTSSVSSQVPLCSNVPSFNPNHPPPNRSTSSAGNATQGCVADNETLKTLVKSVQKIQVLLENALASASNSEQSDSEFESFTSAAMKSSSKMSSLPTEMNPFLYSTTTSVSQSSLPSSTFSSISSKGCTRKLCRKSELREESICIRFQHGSCKFSEDHPGNSHLCARCYFSKHMLLEPEHGSDWCQADLS